MRGSSFDLGKKNKRKSISPAIDYISTSDVERLKLANNKDALALKE